MKTQKLTVTNYIYDNYNERGTKAFIKRVTKILKAKCITGNVICLNGYMEKSSGYGSYNFVAAIEINSEIYTLKEFTNDSMAWDEITNDNKDKRNVFEIVISDYDFTDILEEIKDINNF